MSGPDALTMRERFRREREERRVRRTAARHEMDRRVAETMAMIPGLLRTEIPESIRDWPRNMILGVLVGAFDGRDYRVSYLEDPKLAEETDALVKRIEAGEEEPEAIRRLVAAARERVRTANEEERAAVPENAAAVSRYVSGHMRMAFRPYGRAKLDAAMEGHLRAILDNPFPWTLAAEERLGRLELECADQLEAERRGAAPGPR